MSAFLFVLNLPGRRICESLVLAVWLFVSCQGLAVAQTSQTTTDLLEQTLEKFVPKSPRTEGEEDRLLAAAQFAHGRMMVQREQYPAALRDYERAFRNDPSPVIARELIAVAGELHRNSEAVRYAILSAESEIPETDLSLRLAAILGEQGDFSRAVRLLERAVEKEMPPATGMSTILLRAELMRMYFMTEQFQLAAKSADVVRDSIQQPEKFGLSAADQKKLQGQRDRLQPMIAEIYLRAQRFVDAEAILRANHESKPNALLLNLGLARIAVEQKDWIIARERLTNYFREKSTVGGLEPYELLTRVIEGQAGDGVRAKEEIVTALKSLREQDPRNIALGYFTAARLLAADRLDEAATLYEDLITRQPTKTGYRDLAQIYRRKKDVVALLGVLARAVEQAGSRELFAAEGQTLAQDVAVFNQLLELLRSGEADRVRLQTPWAFVAVSLLAMDAQKVDVARELYEKALAAPQSDPVKIRETVGLAALVADQHALAIDIFRQAIAAQPAADKLAMYHFYLSGALELSGDTDGALSAAEKCASLQKDSAQFQARPAWVLYHAKRFDLAEQRYRELVGRFELKYESDEVRAQLRQARLILSNICVLQERLPESEEWLEQVLDEFPEDIGALNDLGYLWADRGKRLQRALRMIEKAVAAEPNNIAYRDSLGWAYYRLGRYDEAIRELERAAVGDKDGVIYDHLGDVYLKLDNRSQAVASWKKGVELMRDSDEAKQRAATTAKINEFSTTK